ncbi:MAG: peptidoglycan-binding domain-containing protein [Candidatus Pacebacteria bacterium]|nr:peptidoglycan-binding domain-containing protein [Candidatus Paceibacterota bacterium]
MIYRKLKFSFCLGIFFFILIIGLNTSQEVFAQDIHLGQERSFNIQFDYDFFGRANTETELIKITNKLYFYADKELLKDLSSGNRQEIDNKLYSLANEFEYKIYPNLTRTFGNEDNPGIDNNSRIIVVLHKMKPTIGGYIQAEDHYSAQLYPRSNMGQIIYLNFDDVLLLSLDNLSYHLAHEFLHLITLNQNPKEEIWLNEARAEYTETLLGYGGQWDQSSVRNRLQQFLRGTELSLLNWNNSSYDYAKVNLLAHYLVDFYDVDILVDSLKSPFSGIDALNYAFKKNGFSEDFSIVFMNWVIANAVNNCSLGEKYCYQSSFLQDFTLFPYTYYLPIQNKSSLSVTDSIKNWEAKWQKIMGGSGMIKLKFTIPEQTPIDKIPYIIESVEGKKTIGFFDFSATNIQEVYIEGMGAKNKAVYFIPFIASFGNEENKTYYYSWEVINVELNKQQEEEIIQALLKKIDELKRQVVLLQTQIAMQKTYQNSLSCSIFSQDLYYGMNSSEVECLQQFLVNIGNDIYPEKLVTGYFGPLTQAAVQRYQAFKGIITTGYFGPLTRIAANQNL